MQAGIRSLHQAAQKQANSGVLPSQKQLRAAAQGVNTMLLAHAPLMQARQLFLNQHCNTCVNCFMSVIDILVRTFSQI